MKSTLYLLLVSYTGLCSMGLEMTAVRLLAPFFGTSNYIWTNVIGIILLALSLGYYLGGRLADRRPRLKVLAAWVLAAGLLGLPIPFAIRPLAEFVLPASLTLDNAFVLILKGSFLGALLFAPTILILGMVSPFVIRLMSEETGRIGESSGKVFACSTIGSILGIYLATLVLIPLLGTRTTILAFSAGLVVIPAFILARPSRAAVPLVLLALPFLLARGLPLKANPGKVAEWESPYQYIQIREEEGTRLLSLNEGLDSFHSILVEDSYLTGAYYDYYNAFPYLFLGERKLDVAILGGGGGTSARQYRHFFGDRFDLRIDAVEIDPGVTEVGREFFDYPTEHVTVYDLDGRVFVNLAPERYDIVIIDAYSQQVYIPFHLATREFFEGVRRILKPRGVVAMNVGAFRSDMPLVRSILRTVHSVFPNTYVTALKSSRNHIVFALDGIERSELSVATRESRGGELARVTTCVAMGSVAVEPDSSDRLLTDSHAPVEWLTDQMVLKRSREFRR